MSVTSTELEAEDPGTTSINRGPGCSGVAVGDFLSEAADWFLDQETRQSLQEAGGGGEVSLFTASQ